MTKAKAKPKTKPKTKPKADHPGKGNHGERPIPTDHPMKLLAYNLI